MFYFINSTTYKKAGEGIHIFGFLNGRDRWIEKPQEKKLVRQTGYLLYKCVRIRDGLVFWCLNLFLLLFTSKINFVYIIKLLREIHGTKKTWSSFVIAMRKINLILNGDQSHSCMYFEIWVDFLRADKMRQVDF